MNMKPTTAKPTAVASDTPRHEYTAFEVMRMLVVTLSLALAVSAVEASTATTADWRFEVFLNNKPIGFHDFRVTSEDGEQRIEIDADFAVKVLFVTAYRYEHQNTERWEGNCLTGIEADTNANGKSFQVRGERSDDGFSLTTGPTPEALPGCVQTFAYWNKSILSAKRLLNSQTGTYEPVSVTALGVEEIDVNGTPVRSNRYELMVGDNPISLWYDASDNRWLALETAAAGGRTLRYVPREVPPPALPAMAGLADVAERQDSSDAMRSL